MTSQTPASLPQPTSEPVKPRWQPKASITLDELRAMSREEKDALFPNTRLIIEGIRRARMLKAMAAQSAQSEIGGAS